jgi:hypothetical protein
VYRFKTLRTVPGLGIHEVGYAAWQYSLITPPGGRRYPRHSPVDGQRQCGNMRNATDARLLTSAPLSAADSQGAEGGDHRFFR